jgi:hypothetical protein
MDAIGNILGGIWDTISKGASTAWSYISSGGQYVADAGTHTSSSIFNSLTGGSQTSAYLGADREEYTYNVQDAARSLGIENPPSSKVIDDLAVMSDMVYLRTNDPRYTEYVEAMRRTGLSVTAVGVDADGLASALVVTNLHTRETQVAFRGSSNYEDFRTNVPRMSWRELPGGERVHAGFADAYNRISDELKAAIPADATRISFTGHSLGGAQAQLAALDLAKTRTNCQMDICTFGAPNVGDAAFAESINRVTNGNTLHFIGDTDPVPGLCRPLTGYAASGHSILITSNGLLPLFESSAWNVPLALVNLAVSGNAFNHGIETTYRRPLASAAQIQESLGNNSKPWLPGVNYSSANQGFTPSQPLPAVGGDGVDPVARDSF